MNDQDRKTVIQSVMDVSDDAVMNALVIVFENQTEDEQRSELTMHDNGIGFSGADAEFMTSLAKQVYKSGSLSPKQMNWARKIMKKYWKQVFQHYDGDLSGFTTLSVISEENVEWMDTVYYPKY